MIRVVFMGSPEFSVPILRSLAMHYAIPGVVCQPDRPAGRGRALRPPATKQAALDLGLEVFQPAKLRSPEALAHLRTWVPDVIVVAAFGQILRPEVLALPGYGCVNVHASLLPRWRGAAPIQAAIAAGDPETGVTIMKMDEGLDTGGILTRQPVIIHEQDTYGSLSEKLSTVGADLLIDTLPGYISGERLPQAQDENQVSYAPMLKKEDGLLDFAQSAAMLSRRVRAFSPWPGTFLMWKGNILKVHRAHPEPGMAPVGQRLTVRGQPAVATNEGLLVLDEIQPAGKRTMTGQAFLAGAQDWSN